MRSSLLLILLITFSTSNYIAQITEGTITYSIYMDSDDDEMNKAENVIAQSILELSFSGNKTKSIVSTGDDLTMATILDGDSKKGIMTMTGMLGNLAITAEYSEIVGENVTGSTDNLELLDRTKTISGYECHKARLTKSNGSVIIYWYSNEIKFNITGIENFSPKLPGTPLKMNIETDGILMTYEAKIISNKLDTSPDQLFTTTAPEGFKVISIQQFEAGEF